MAKDVPLRRLGANGPMVPALGLGLMGLSAAYHDEPEPDEERFKFLDAAVAMGCTNFDSADIYGDNEDLLGKWFAHSGKRDQVFLATKFANFREGGKSGIRNDPAYVKEACAKSLKRLGVDQIDLYYCHRFNREVPVEEIVGAMKELVEYARVPNDCQGPPVNQVPRKGKVKYLGLSECSAETLRRAHRVHPIAAVQLEYSPWSMDIEDPHVGLLAACRELGVATIAYSPLGRGFLTGSIRSPDDLDEKDVRRGHPRFSRENFPKNLELADRIKAIADRKGCTAGQLTLAWLMAQGEDVIPIPGTRKIKYLEENWGALDVKVTSEGEKEIRKATLEAEVIGDRYGAASMQAVFADTPPLKA